MDRFNVSDLEQFTGTENWYRYPLVPNLTFTDGVHYLAEKAGAFWLIDFVASHQHESKFKNSPFQVWKLTVVNHVGTFTVTDGDDNILATYTVHYTDFPADSVTVWVEDGGPQGSRVILLPSEH